MLDVTFRALEPSDEAAVAEAQHIMATEDFPFVFDYAPNQDFSAWLERIEAQRLGRCVAPGKVAATFEVATLEGRIAGRLSVRHELNDFLLQRGGHIGYGVLPAYRRRGLGKQMLKRGLEITAALAIRRVLVTCDEDNAASRKIIESAGGVYESSYAGPDANVPIRRYWFG